MKKIYKINDEEISIRRIKVREIKEIIANSKDKVNEFVTLLDSQNLIEDLIGFISSNLDKVTNLTQQFTDLDKDKIEDMDALDLVEILRKMLEINGIKEEKIKAFLQKLKTINPANQAQKMNQQFVKQVPMNK